MSVASQADQVLGWPVITARVGVDGSGLLDVAGVRTEVAAVDLAGARAQVMGQLVSTAAGLGRGVQASVEGPEGTFVLVVHPDGTVVDMTPAPRRRGLGGLLRGRATPGPATGEAAPVLDAAPPAGDPKPHAGESQPPTAALAVSEVGADVTPSTEGDVDAAAPVEAVEPVAPVEAVEAVEVVEVVERVEVVGELVEVDETAAAFVSGDVDDDAAAPTTSEALEASPVTATAVTNAGEDDGRPVVPVSLADELSELTDPVRRPVRRRGVLAGVVAGGLVLTGGGVWGVLEVAQHRTTQALVRAEHDAAMARIRAQHAADVFEREWIATQQHSARQAQLDAQHAEQVAGARVVLAAASTVLDASAGKVGDDNVRVELATVIGEATSLLDEGAPVGVWHDLVRVQVPAAQLQVSEAQTAWQAAEDARLEAERQAAEQAAAAAAAQAQAQADAARRSAGSSGSGPRSGDNAPQQQAPAPQRGGGGGGGGGSSQPGGSASIRASVSSGAGSATVTVTVSGGSGPVIVTVGGRSVTAGSGSGTFTATVSGLPAGSHAWSAAGGGVSTSGSIQVF